MIDKKSVAGNAPTLLAATGGLITAIIGLLTFMSVPAPSIAEFDASPNIISAGESSILKWSVTGDEATVNIDPGIGIVGLSGTREVAPSINTSYFLTAKNKDKEKIASVQIIVRKKNEANQVTNDVVGGIAAKYDVPMPPEVNAEPDQKQNVIHETLPPEAEPANPDEPEIVLDSDSQQNAVAQPAQMVTRIDNSSKSPAIDQSGMRQNAIDASVSAIEPDIAPQSNASEANASESIAHVEFGLNESSKITERKTAKVITAADWGSFNNVSRSENDFASSAPIYAKLRNTRHTTAISPDFQDPAVSDPGFAGPDYLGPDMQSQGSSGMDTQVLAS